MILPRREDAGQRSVDESNDQFPGRITIWIGQTRIVDAPGAREGCHWKDAGDTGSGAKLLTIDILPSRKERDSYFGAALAESLRRVPACDGLVRRSLVSQSGRGPPYDRSIADFSRTTRRPSLRRRSTLDLPFRRRWRGFQLLKPISRDWATRHDTSMGSSRGQIGQMTSWAGSRGENRLSSLMEKRLKSMKAHP